jgi:hypothetical protein
MREKEKNPLCVWYRNKKKVNLARDIRSAVPPLRVLRCDGVNGLPKYIIHDSILCHRLPGEQGSGLG